MALKKSFVVKGTNIINGEPFAFVIGEMEYATPMLYIKVQTVTATKESATVSVAYLNNDQQIAIKQFTFIPNMDGENFIKQAYLHLKSLDEFAGAVDC